MPLVVNASDTKQSQAGWWNFCVTRLVDGTNCGVRTWQRAADTGRVPIPRFVSEHGDAKHTHRSIENA